MKFFVLACILALCWGRPDKLPLDKETQSKFVKILKDERSLGLDGSYSVNYKTDDGITRYETGRRLHHLEDSPIGQEGFFEFYFPTGEKFFLKYVADENGFRAESPWLPVAPLFPHPIPDFVSRQIEKAAREDLEDETITQTRRRRT